MQSRVALGPRTSRPPEEAAVDALRAITTRRSIRQFTDAPVTAEQVETLLRAAMAAPSAGNQQPWRFVVVRDPRRARASPWRRRTPSPVGRAPLGIVVLADTRENKHPGYWVQDCSAAVENLLLAAHAMGLGACVDRRASRPRTREAACARSSRRPKASPRCA